MGLDQKAILAQIDSLLERHANGRARSEYDDLSDLPEEEISELLTLMAAAVDRLAPPNSRYVETMRTYIKNYGATNASLFPILVGIMRALRADIVAGNLQSIGELIRGDVFGDFLEMADHLHEQGYKDPAAVIAGAVLEDHLRNLALKNGIAQSQGSRPKKADALNAELAAANAYSKLDQKSITAWLDLRNKAAHGRYGDYSNDQVALLIQSIRDFVSRHPA